ncbi:hypothetical protein F5878DRAFT_205017 [Lentinula raphanica]|uniref:F-box domain-containing protein n=1 Tax=Lentinula raphanica TaxID=153919 RepID=A0AA38UGT4_9AGAR|nr:hypothetical protein F5878DRAFT_205017 [Lentinula raphanica]
MSVSALPEELLLRILRLACGLSNNNIDYAPRLLYFPVELVGSKALRKTREHRRRIILVSKLWYRIGLPCLYEEIAILDDIEVESLYIIQTLSKNKDLGRYTKRLDIGRAFIKPPGVNFNIIRPLLDLLVNLQALRIDSSCFPVPVPFSFTERHPNRSTLRVLHNPYHSLSPSPGSPLPSLTPKTSSFKAITFTNFDDNGDVLDDPFAHLSALPNLSQIYFPYYFLDMEHIMQRSKLLSVTSILIGTKYKTPYATVLAYIGDALPNLRYLGIRAISLYYYLYSSSHDITGSLRPLAIPAQVHTLGLIFDMPKSETKAYRALNQQLVELEADGLRNVHFGEEMLGDLQNRPVAAALLKETFRARGWCLKFGDIPV